MVTNVGTIDRALRIVIGFVLIAYALKLGFPSTGWNWVGWIGVRASTHRLCRRLPALQRAWREYLFAEVNLKF